MKEDQLVDRNINQLFRGISHLTPMIGHRSVMVFVCLQFRLCCDVSLQQRITLHLFSQFKTIHYINYINYISTIYVSEF